MLLPGSLTMVNALATALSSSLRSGSVWAIRCMAWLRAAFLDRFGRCWGSCRPAGRTLSCLAVAMMVAQSGFRGNVGLRFGLDCRRFLALAFWLPCFYSWWFIGSLGRLGWTGRGTMMSAEGGVPLARSWSRANWRSIRNSAAEALGRFRSGM